ncbi:MAG: PF13754 domain-containing protein [Bacillota bacterium]|nr:PF13754 domain-containing protein [Bacillota bacterium]
MKLTGYINGTEICFDFRPPSTFAAEIPRNISGVYILELHAADNAGNQANECSAAVLVNFNELIFKILDIEYGYEPGKEEFKFTKLPPEFSYKELVHHAY